MTAAVIWLIAGLVLVSVEVLSGEFVLLMLGAGAFAAAVASLLGLPVLGGVLVFGGASVLLLFAVRPTLRRRLDRGVSAQPMHARALEGGTGVVVARVDGHGGRVKIGGDLWSAKALHGAEVIEPGAQVTIVTIDGATAMVVSKD
jgi:membrane protein implicated in regulation of membrane protease activity